MHIHAEGGVMWVRARARCIGENELSSRTNAPAEADLGQQRPDTDSNMREIVHIQAGQCGNQIGTKVRFGRHFREQQKSDNIHNNIIAINRKDGHDILYML